MIKSSILILFIVNLLVSCNGGITEYVSYKAEAVGSKSSNIYSLELPIDENNSLGIDMLCHPKKTHEEYYSCSITIFKLLLNNSLSHFENSNFSVLDAYKNELNISISDQSFLLPLSRHPNAKSLTRISIKFKKLPKKVYLDIPQLLINGKIYNVQEVKFFQTEYRTDFQFFPMIPINN